MTICQRIRLPYHPWSGDSDVFARSLGEITSSFGKDGTARDKERQDHFERQLLRIRDAVGSSTLPVFIEWNDGVRNRMDKGCIGHSIARGFIQRAVIDEAGHVTQIVLA